MCLCRRATIYKDTRVALCRKLVPSPFFDAFDDRENVEGMQRNTKTSNLILMKFYTTLRASFPFKEIFQ